MLVLVVIWLLLTVVGLVLRLMIERPSAHPSTDC